MKPPFLNLKKGLFFCLLLIATINTLWSQSTTIEVPLKTAQGNEPFGFNSWSATPYQGYLGDFTGIPADMDTFFIWEIHLQQSQYLFEKYQMGMIEKEDVEHLLGEEIDPKNFSKKPIKETLYIFVGLKTDKKHVIVDANNNGDFGDDELFVFDTSMAEEEYNIYQKADIPAMRAYRNTLPHLPIQYEYFYQGQLHNGQLEVTIIPFSSGMIYNDPVQEELSVDIELHEHQLGEFTLPNGKRIKTAVSAGPPSALFTRYKASVNFCEYDQLFVADLTKRIKQGESRFIDSFKIHVDHIDPLGKSLQLTFEKHSDLNQELSDNSTEFESSDGFTVGTASPQLMSTDLKGNTFNLYEQKGKYVLLDFWGTWCKPCVVAMPKLQAFHQGHKSKDWMIVGIAVDQDIKLVESFVEKRNIPWRQLFIDTQSSEDGKLLNSFEIEGFPTYILIGPDSKILALGNSEELEGILELLGDKLEKK